MTAIPTTDRPLPARTCPGPHGRGSAGRWRATSASACCCSSTAICGSASRPARAGQDGGFDPATLGGRTSDGARPAADARRGCCRTTRRSLAGETRRFVAQLSTDGLPQRPSCPSRATDGAIAGALALAFDDGEELRAERAAAPPSCSRRLAQQSAVARLGELALRRAAARGADGRGLRGGRRRARRRPRPRGRAPGRRARCAWPRAAGWPDGLRRLRVRDAVVHRRGRPRAATRAGPVVIDDLPNDAALARPAAARARRRVQRDGAARRPARARRRCSAPAPARGGSFGERTSTSSPRSRTCSTARWRACAPRSGSATTRCTTRSPACPTAPCCSSACSDAIARADAEGRSLALFFLDVDHLKVLNDSLGHHAGDELLRAIGPRLRAVLRPDDMIARFGGDEFAVLCEGVGDEAHALRVAERLVRAFAQPFEVRGEPRFCSTSVGVVVSDPAGPRGPSRAALGRRRGALPRQGARPRPPRGLRRRPARPHTARLQIEADLRRALEAGDQLWVAYQPLLRAARAGDVRGGGAAALGPSRARRDPARRVHPRRRGLRPDRRARRVRAAHRLPRTLARWPGLVVSVNVSARQMELTGMPGVVGAVLRDSGSTPAGSRWRSPRACCSRTPRRPRRRCSRCAASACG